MKNILLVLGLLCSSQQLMAASANLLGPDLEGRPQIEITGSGKYFIFHAVDDDRIGCDTSRYVDVQDSSSKHWCRSFNAYSTGAIVSDPVPFDVVADSSPLEIEYKVGTSPNVDSGEYIGWSPKRARDPLVDPLQTWLSTLQTNYGVTFPSGTLASIKTASEKGAKQQVTVTYNTAGRVWTFYFNNKYVALFNHQGALLGLAHTAYGDELINPYHRLVTTGGNDDLRGFLLNTTVETLGPSNFPTPTINADGSMTVIWTNMYSLGFDIRADWKLNSRYTADSPPGLSGHARVDDTDTGNSRAPTGLSFPVIFGLATGTPKNVFVPRFNSGNFYPVRSTVGANTYLATGDYPTTSWQAPIVVVSNDVNSSVLISANDPNQRVKGFSVSDLESGDVAGKTMFSSYLQNGVTDVVESSGNVTISPMYGNWIAAANKYRRWVDRQTWGHGNTLLGTNADRNIDATLKKGVYWWSEPAWGGNDPLRPSAFKDDANYQKQIVGPTLSGGGIDVGFHLYSWWDKNFDTNYPKYVATTDTVGLPLYVTASNPSASPITWAQSITAVQGDGSLVAPYINSIGIDVSNAPSSSSGVVRDTSKCPVDTSGNGWWTPNLFSFNGSSLDLTTLMVRKRTDNTPYSACFGSRTFAFAGVDSSLWRSIVTNNMNNVFDNLGSSGIYLDSFANSDGSYDRAATPSGRGDWVRQGTRGLGSEAQTVAVTKGTSTTRKFIAAEHFSELTLPYVDIVMNYEDPDPRALPMLQAMYNQNELFAGQRTKNTQSLAAKKAVLGRSFVWGYQLGLSWYRYLCGYANTTTMTCTGTDNAELTSYIRTLMAAREAVQDPSIGLVWSNARLTGMADGTDSFAYSNANGTDWCDDPTVGTDTACPATLPRLRGAYWSSAGNDLPDFLVITNVSGDTTLQSDFTLPKSWTGAQIVYGTGASLNAGTNTIAVGPGSVVVYKANISTDIDTDADGIVDALDDDDDNDGIVDTADAFPTSAAAAVDTDGDGKPDAWNSGCDANCQQASGLTLDTDSDNDGVPNTADNCPTVANASQTDIDGNGVGDACQHGLTASYFNDTDTNGSGGITESDAKLVPPAVLQRIEPNIDFNYGLLASPGTGVNVDYFSARFTGRLIVPAYTGNYTFCLKGDDGVRLWINGVDLFEDAHWVPQDSVTDCAAVSLTAGQVVPIKMEFFDLTEEAIAQLKWSWPGHAADVVPNSNLYAQ